MSHITRIAIIEHHDLIRRGMADLLSKTGGPALRVAAVVQEPWQLDPEEAYYDALLFGPSAPTEKALAEAVEPLTARGRVLVVMNPAGGQGVVDVLRAGAHGAVTRQAGDDELLCAVVTTARGGLYLSPGLGARLHKELRGSAVAPASLAPRETEALRWLAAGLTHRQIGRRMELTEATVSTYVKRIKNKLNVGNKADLTRKAIELGLIDLGPAHQERSADDAGRVVPACG